MIIILSLLISITSPKPLEDCWRILGRLHRAESFQSIRSEVVLLSEHLKNKQDDSHLHIWQLTLEKLNDDSLNRDQQFELFQILGLLK